MEDFITHPLVVAAYTVLLASIIPIAIAAGRGRRRRARRLDDLVSELHHHVIPHFRPATLKEIREGHRRYGDTLPERTVVLEAQTGEQTKALVAHLEAETKETSEVKERLGRLERHLNVPNSPREGE